MVKAYIPSRTGTIKGQLKDLSYGSRYRLAPSNAKPRFCIAALEGWFVLWINPIFKILRVFVVAGFSKIAAKLLANKGLGQFSRNYARMIARVGDNMMLS